MNAHVLFLIITDYKYFKRIQLLSSSLDKMFGRVPHAIHTHAPAPAPAPAHARTRAHAHTRTHAHTHTRTHAHTHTRTHAHTHTGYHDIRSKGKHAMRYFCSIGPYLKKKTHIKTVKPLIEINSFVARKHFVYKKLW